MKNTLSLRHDALYESLIFFYLCVELINRIPTPDSMHAWCTTFYALTYRLGFASRMFIGSVVNALTSYLTKRVLWLIILTSLIFLIALTSIIIGQLIRNSRDEIKSFLVGLTVLFLASPASISYLFYWGNFGRLELYMLIFVLLSFMVLQHPIARWLIPIMCIMAIATHQIFVFLFFAPLLIAACYEMQKEQFSPRSQAFVFAFVLTVSMAFFVFQFVKSLHYLDASSMLTDMASYTNIPLEQSFLSFEYFSTLKENIEYYASLGGSDLYIRGFITLLLVSPLMLFFIRFWKGCLKIEKNGYLRVLYLIAMLSPLATIPAFVVAIDWGRWFAAAFLCQFALIYYFVANMAEAPVVVAYQWSNKVKSDPFPYLVLIVYLNTLGKFEALAVLNVASHLGDTVNQWLEYVAK